MPVYKQVKKQPVTIVKQLRELTGTWTEEYGMPSSVRVYQVKDLIDQLPAFRAAPQTKLENTLRAIEALLRVNLGVDLAQTPIKEHHGTSVNNRTLVLAICRIINTHHGINAADVDATQPEKPKVKKTTAKIYAEMPSPSMQEMPVPAEPGDMPTTVMKAALMVEEHKKKENAKKIAAMKKMYGQVVEDMQATKGEA